MPVLHSLAVRHFRCFERFETEFAPGINLIVGPNAHGKTSLLEAACILLRLQSPRVARLATVVQHERRGLVVDGYLDARHLQFYYSAARRKLALDGVEQAHPREYLHLGRLMYFAMSDIELVRGSSETRRRFLDFVATQLAPPYRQALRDYERALRSRNALLKAPRQRWSEIEAFEGPLLVAGAEVARLRRELLTALQPFAATAHSAISAISATREELVVEYVSGAGKDFATALAASRDEDARLRQTCVGPHRDDFRFQLNTRGAEFASEGQQRTMVLALKLGAARLLEAQERTPPILLLDDIFGELDTQRRGALLAALPAHGQALITTTSTAWWPAALETKTLRLGLPGP